MSRKAIATSVFTAAILLSTSSIAMPATARNQACAIPESSTAEVKEVSAKADTEATQKTSEASPFTEDVVIGATFVEQPMPVETLKTKETDEIVSGVSMASLHYYKPGQQKAYNGRVITFTHFAKVTEYISDNKVTLSGSWATGDWKYAFIDGETTELEKSENLPFSIEYTDYALGMPIAMSKGTTDIDGFTFNLSDDETVTYEHAPSCTHVWNDKFDSYILDYTRFCEFSYTQAGRLDLFQNADKYEYVTSDGESWIIATDNHPEIKKATPENNLFEVTEKASKLRSIGPITDVKTEGWALKWDDIEELSVTENKVTYELKGHIGDQDFNLEIKTDEAALGFTKDHSWSGAIVPADYVTKHDEVSLHYNHYVITIADDIVSVFDSETGETSARILDSNKAMDDVVLVTLTDGKHASALNFDSRYINLIWSLAE